MTDKALYTAIYDMVESRMQEAGRTLGSNKAACIDLADCPPGTADALELTYEDNPADFLRKVYLSMLGRPIDDAALEEYTRLAQQDPLHFQSAVINGIKSSEEFVLSRTVLTNNLCTDHAVYAETHISSFSRAAFSERLLRIYRKMPEPVKKAAKKILRSR